MKLSAFLYTSLVASVGATSLSLAGDKNVADLSNGAELGVNIITTTTDSTQQLAPDTANRGVSIQGTAHVGKGAPDVAYIYIIDSSGSTGDYDGDCGSTLDCVQAFFEELHTQVQSDGSGELVAVVDFDDQAQVTASFQDPSNDAVVSAIHQSYSDGGTACSHALETATLLVHQQKTASHTVVIFAGDGLCNGGDEGATVVGENVTDSANLLGDTGAVVHSIAVGDAVDCDAGNDLVNIPRNGGQCFSIPEPKALPTIIDDLIGTTLTNLEIKVDGGVYRELDASEIGGKSLPIEGAVEVNFEASVWGLVEGDHTVCIRATGQDSLGGESRVEDCRTVTIEAPPTASPTQAPTRKELPIPLEKESEPLVDGSFSSDYTKGWQIFLAVAGCVGVLAIALHQMIRRGSDASRANDLAPEHRENAARPPVVVDHGVPADAPVQIV